MFTERDSFSTESRRSASSCVDFISTCLEPKELVFVVEARESGSCHLITAKFLEKCPGGNMLNQTPSFGLWLVATAKTFGLRS